jgi:hypothetical protein
MVDPPVDILYEFEVKRRSEATSDLVLALPEVGAIGLEPVCPNVSAGFGINQLHIYADLITRPPDTPSRT